MFRMGGSAVAINFSHRLASNYNHCDISITNWMPSQLLLPFPLLSSLLFHLNVRRINLNVSFCRKQFSKKALWGCKIQFVLFSYITVIVYFVLLYETCVQGEVEWKPEMSSWPSLTSRVCMGGGGQGCWVASGFLVTGVFA